MLLVSFNLWNETTWKYFYIFYYFFLFFQVVERDNLKLLIIFISSDYSICAIVFFLNSSTIVVILHPMFSIGLSNEYSIRMDVISKFLYSTPTQMYLEMLISTSSPSASSVLRWQDYPGGCTFALASQGPPSRQPSTGWKHSVKNFYWWKVISHQQPTKGQTYKVMWSTNRNPIAPSSSAYVHHVRP